MKLSKYQNLYTKFLYTTLQKRTETQDLIELQVVNCGFGDLRIQTTDGYHINVICYCNSPAQVVKVLREFKL